MLRKTVVGIVAAFLMAVIIGGCATTVEHETPRMDYQTFVNPPSEFRSVTFWSLNDNLEPNEIARQMAEFDRGGFGGAYLHSRTGLLTEYLGPDWWKAMDAGVRAAERLGLQAWFYDEDKWPSGFAGGIVPRASEDYHARALIRLEKDANIPEKAEILTEDANYLYLCYKSEMGNPWFNGTCWVDLMNPDTVKTFIDCSYRPYAERYADKIGSVVHGIFSDEPQISPRHISVRHKGAVAYSPIIRQDFIAQHGYDFVDHVASLFENIGDYPKVRLDYFRTVSGRFEESFSRQIGQYCAKTGMVWTGHYNGEEYLLPVAANVGNMMIQYRHMQQPGIDHLGLRIDEGLIPARSLSSVANQYGIERRLSELFGISGQNMSFEDRRWIANWHTALGINHFCPHLSLYSMKGCRKRDYPPTFFYQQPYWPYNKIVEDYMARICYAATLGTYAPEILVIHPLESVYIENRWTESKWSTDRGLKYYKVLETLQKAHRDYDLGDEQIISEIGSARPGEILVGRMKYEAIVLPHMLTIRPGTLKLLEAFAGGGMPVFVVGQLPQFVDGRRDAESLRRLRRITRVVPLAELAANLAHYLPPAVRVEAEDSELIWIHRRVIDAGQILQLTNTSRQQGADCQVYLQYGTGNSVVWDPADGRCYCLLAGTDGGFGLHLAPAQTLIITTGAACRDAYLEGLYGRRKKATELIKLSGPWLGRRRDLNALTLDFARYSTDSGQTFSRREPVIGIAERFRRTQYSGPLMLEFDVRIDEIPGKCELVLEQPNMYKRITVNGRLVKFSGNDFYRDISFQRADIAPLLKKRANTITLMLDYFAPSPASYDAYERYGTEIESIYLIGEFGVSAAVSSEPPAPTQRNSCGFLAEQPVRRFSSFGITAETALFEGDLTLQGYPFYAGRFELVCHFDMERLENDRSYFLTFPDVQAIVVTAELNGKTLPSLAWNPWEIDITEALTTGGNRLKLTLVNSLRNLLGPHHHRDGELIRVGPKSFTGQTTWTGGGPGEDNWYDVRIQGHPKIWRDDYHHVPFGLLKPPAIVIR